MLLLLSSDGGRVANRTYHHGSAVSLSITQKRYRRYKLMRGHLPWNRWTPYSFRAAIYKYVSEDDYKNLRSKKGLAESERDYESISNGESNNYNTAMLSPISTHRNIQNVQQNLFQREFTPNYKESFHYNSQDPTQRTYDFNESEGDHPTSFQSDLWTKYAFKTFLIDRTKYGNLPMYYDYAQHRHTYYTEIRNIKGSKEVEKIQEIDFVRCLNAYLGKNVDITVHQGAVKIWGKNWHTQTRQFLLKMGF